MLYEAEHIYLQWCCLLKRGNLRKHYLVLKSETQLTKQRINRIGLKTNSRHIGEKIVENEKLVKLKFENCVNESDSEGSNFYDQA